MNVTVTSWKAFDRHLRPRQQKLLARVPFLRNDLIFVAGCQRSGTTMLTKVLMRSSQINEYRTNLDSELEGALILAGVLPELSSDKRLCFQTTYLNEKYTEYFEHKGRFKLAFVVRNPFSVVYSMMHHWVRRRDLRNFPLNELFSTVGKEGLLEKEKRRFDLLGTWGFSRLRKACLAYTSKTSQLHEIKKQLGEDVLVIEYDDIIQKSDDILPHIFDFFGLPYESSCRDIVNTNSLKKSDKLSPQERKVVESTCLDVYEKAKALAI